MIDPVNITKFKNTDEELEEVLMFWVAVAGKNAITTSKSLDKFLNELRVKYKITGSPFALIRQSEREELPMLLKSNGIGCYNQRAESFWQLAHAELDLRKCSAEDLEKIKGIGMKTSRCFLIHTRKNAGCAGLDVHIKKFLHDLGINIPKSVSRSKYLELETIFVKLAKRLNKSIADLDLIVWKYYSGNDNNGETLSFLRSIKVEELL